MVRADAEIDRMISDGNYRLLTVDDMPEIDIGRVQQAFVSHHHRIIVDPNELGIESRSVFSLFGKRLPHIDRSSWPERTTLGGVILNGINIQGDCSLLERSCIEYYEPKKSLAELPYYYPKWDPNWLIYQDSVLLVAFKPSGLPTQPAREQQHWNMRCYLESYADRSIHMPSRLDMSTSGLVIASISPEHHRHLQESFAQRQVRKAYLLASHHRPKWQEIVAISRIKRHPLHPVLRSTCTEEGKEATTIFRVLGSHDDLCIVLAVPITGRTHQIRVHATALGIPIAGDRFYGGIPAPSLHLLSAALTLRHPELGEECSFRVPGRLLPPWAKSAATTLFQC